MPTKCCTWLGWWWANLRLQSVAQMIKESPLINRTSITTAVKSFFVCVKQSDRKCTWLFATSHRMDHLAFPICQIVFGYRLNRCVSEPKYPAASIVLFERTSWIYSLSNWGTLNIGWLAVLSLTISADRVCVWHCADEATTQLPPAYHRSNSPKQVSERLPIQVSVCTSEQRNAGVRSTVSWFGKLGLQFGLQQQIRACEPAEEAEEAEEARCSGGRTYQFVCVLSAWRRIILIWQALFLLSQWRRKQKA